MGADVSLDASPETGQGGQDSEASCDPSSDPSVTACLLDNRYGVFVAATSSGGSDTTGDGTMARPFATIARGLASLGGKNHLYLCEGAFTESVTLTSPVSVYGGFACPGDGGTWSLSDGGQSNLTAPASQVPLYVDGLDASATISDLSIAAMDAIGVDLQGSGASSVAVVVNAATVLFRRCTLSAGAGANGADGISGVNDLGATAQNGLPTDGGVGGPGGFASCADGTISQGGTGGDAVVGPIAGGMGMATPMPPTNQGFDGLGATGGTTSCGLGGDPGANGASGLGSQPKSAYGSLSAAGWIPNAGAPGADGDPGQGGGGGGGKSGPQIGGGGGGAGGCGGAGASGGGAGGSSISMLSISSSVTLDTCRLVTSDAGNGGRGGEGQNGQGGGAPGIGIVGSCFGGYGGNGAGGSGGAGGNGGLSICSVYAGNAPTGSVNCMPGVAGQGGTFGHGAAGGDNSPSQGNAGVRGSDGADGGTGISQDSLLVMP